MTASEPNPLPDVAQTVLVVDDHEGFRLRARRLLERHRYRVIEAPDGATAISRARTGRPDIVLVDIHLPDMSGFDVAKALREDGSTTAILLISTHGLADVGVRVRASVADGFIDKADLSASTITTALEHRA